MEMSHKKANFNRALSIIEVEGVPEDADHFDVRIQGVWWYMTERLGPTTFRVAKMSLWRYWKLVLKMWLNRLLP